MISEKMEQNLETPPSEKEKILKRLHELRYDFIEEFPPEKLLPDMPNYDRYKCRSNFFHAISLKIARLKLMNLINSDDAKQECEDFLKFCTTLQGTSKFYQQEDIDKANKVLDCLIKELS